MFPGAQRMNRGNHEITALVQACKANNVTDLVIVHETRGQPGTSVYLKCRQVVLICVYMYYRSHLKQPVIPIMFFFIHLFLFIFFTH